MDVISKPFVVVVLLLGLAASAAAALDMSIISYEARRGVGGLRRSEEDVRRLYEEWMAKHRRSYDAIVEKEKRFVVFMDNLRFVDAHNAAAEAGGRGFHPRGQPFRRPHQRGVPGGVPCHQARRHCRAESSGERPQELVDCDTAYNLGCNGGIMDYAFAFIISNGGVDTEDDYPYNGHEAKKMQKAVSIDGFEDVPTNDENALLEAVANQPVGVAIEAGSREFQLYQSIMAKTIGLRGTHGARQDISGWSVMLTHLLESVVLLCSH
ncbi:hypothetical protein B296_00017186 [Ensete ventricosum]|uniref:Cathepsin propeptide inhibitor domain-containing protein n=1 Tax=Ensete ventricosum TaxID=4639 RepID=A0A426XI46_ENSVE|nr:hypothetical protein B296_00017186 [Ensete ventricosum]